MRFVNYSCRRTWRRRRPTRLGGELLEARQLLAGHPLDSAVVTPLAQWNAAAIDPVRDADVRVSAEGRLYYVDHAQPAEPADSLPEPAPTDTSGVKIALDRLPQLNSDPNSKNAFYLDFTGATVSGTDWNRTDNKGRDIHAVPYDLDGDLETFSEEEVAAIEEIWQRVSEDFSPFDINITTVEPSPGQFRDGRGAIRAIISTNIDDEATGGTGEEWFKNAGGVAYVGSWTTPGDMPVWVFYNKLPNQVKAVAEATSHEFGHALGLSHDGGSGSAYYGGHGTGDTGWAPIMGRGYDRNVTQWSRGDYPGANNDERDLDIITSAHNRIAFREDDHGNWEPDATPISRVGNRVHASGVIEENTDLDFFSFDHSGGPVQFRVSPAETGPNLDVIAGLYDEDRNELIVSEPNSSLASEIDIDLEAGTYYLFVEGGGHVPERGVGFDDYASLGRYFVSGVLGQPTLTAHPGGNVGGSACCQGAGCPACLGDSYLILEGDDLTLDGRQSVAPSDSVLFEWDVDGDGQFDDAQGPLATLTWAELTELDRPIRDDGEFSVGLRLRDEHGNTAIARTALVVQNRNPLANLAPFDAVFYAGHPIGFQIESTDIPNDPLIVQWDFGDGSEPVVGHETEITHVYPAGEFELVVRVMDDDGGATELTVDVDVQLDVPRIVSTSIKAAHAVIPPTSIRIEFSHDVSATLNPADLYLFDTTDNAIVNPPEPRVNWLGDDNAADFSISGLPAGDYLVVLNGAGIANELGVALDADGSGRPGGSWTRPVTIAPGGDANLDGIVDFEDFVRLATAFGQFVRGWEEADFDGDGLASLSDFVILSTNFEATRG